MVPKGYSAMAIFPFVFLQYKSQKEDFVLLNHERIHLRQQLELFVLPFYFWYFIEYLYRLIQHKSHRLAYRNISFEREAYSNEHDLEYLSQRPFWQFLKYLRGHEVSRNP